MWGSSDGFRGVSVEKLVGIGDDRLTLAGAWGRVRKSLQWSGMEGPMGICLGVGLGRGFGFH